MSGLDADEEVILINNCVARFDEMIRMLVRDPIDQNLTFPKNTKPIQVTAHETACIFSWPEWFADTPPFARLALLIDWRRSLLNQRERAKNRKSTRSQLSIEALLEKRRSDRERKRKSRAKKHALAVASGTWKPRGRPRKVPS